MQGDRGMVVMMMIMMMMMRLFKAWSSRYMQRKDMEQ